MANALNQLSAFTIISADTANYNAVKSYKVSEATTNPCIILQAATLPQYKSHLEEAVAYGLKKGKTINEVINYAMDKILVLFGRKLLEVVTDKVHVQIDPKLAFNTTESVKRSINLVKLFCENGINKNNVVIKLPATWEGIQAAKILEKDYNINCNMTTMFNLTQAATSAAAGVSYLAPFVGRIGMWHQDKNLALNTHKGIETLKVIQSYIKKFQYKTKVMGAYFINEEEIIACSGCDAATIPVELLEKMSKTNKVLVNNMNANVGSLLMDKMNLTEEEFRWSMNEDEMATDLLSSIIRMFTADYVKLENIVRNMLPINK